MSALLILNYDVTDRDGLVDYRAAAGPILLGPGAGELLAMSADTVNVDEGAAAGTDTVVIRFESVEQARELFGSDAYQAVVGDRYANTTPLSAFIVPEL